MDLQTLIGKLNPFCKKALESAAELCVVQTHYNVEMEHFLLALADAPGGQQASDIHVILANFGVRPADVKKELTQSMESFRRGNNRTPALSPHIMTILEQAWMITSLDLNAKTIRSASVFTALMENESLRNLVVKSAPSLEGIHRYGLRDKISGFITQSAENRKKSRAEDTEKNNNAQPESPTPNLDQYTINMTERAQEGSIDPILGRDREIRQLIDILTRRRQNNPILTGEAGVGKTAVVEGLALRIAKGDVPPSLSRVSLRLLDLGLLQAGAGVKGEFEKRLKSVIQEVQESPAPVILFIDEAHTMVGAGGAAGMGDAANLLKPALARGELLTVAATTWSEYKKYFEKDPALARRFQVVKVEEPDEESAVEMLRGVAEKLESHHRVVILDEAVKDAVRLSMRYITGRQLPDKAISVLDTACARVSIGRNTTPAQIEDRVRKLEQIALELSILKKETGFGHDHTERISLLEEKQGILESEQKELETRYSREMELTTRILNIQENIRIPVEDVSPSDAPEEQGMDDNAKLVELKAELAVLQKEDTLVPLCVDTNMVAAVISNWTGVPVGKMLTDEISTILNLKPRLEERIIGQSHALDAICRRIRTYRANLDDPGKPVGVFLLVGPSGIGKTETAIALSEILYGGERNLITINMSEYQEAYTVSGLKGAPPGYVGHGKGGVLTEAVRRRPYSVVLLDEVEKAHPDVMELFYQVFDKGLLEDSEGQVVDFKNTVVLLTSNVGSEKMLDFFSGSREVPDSEMVLEMIRPTLLRYFKPALLGRLVIVPYFPLAEPVVRTIVSLKLSKIKTRFLENHRIRLNYDETILTEIAARCMDADTGARNVDNILTHMLLPELSEELLRRMVDGENIASIDILTDDKNNFTYAFNTLKPREADSGKGDGERQFRFSYHKPRFGQTRPREEKEKPPGWKSILKRPIRFKNRQEN